MQVCSLNTICSLKEPRLLGEIADSKSGAEKCKMSLEQYDTTESKEVHWGHVKRTQSQFEEASTGQKWGITKSNTYNGLKYIKYV